MAAHKQAVTLENCRFGHFCTYRWVDKQGVSTGQADHFYRLEDLHGRPLEEGPYAPPLPQARTEKTFPQEGLFAPYQFPRD